MSGDKRMEDYHLLEEGNSRSETEILLSQSKGKSSSTTIKGTNKNAPLSSSKRTHQEKHTKPLDNDTIKSAVTGWCSGDSIIRETIRTTYGDIEDWDTSAVTNMKELFFGKETFNDNINKWNVSQVTDMSGMFNKATSFNQPLDNKWNVSNVETMKEMFLQAKLFNQNVDAWDVGKVKDMSNMFNGASSFNQELNNWNVANVENMDNLFTAASSFNQPLNKWKVSNVTSMKDMFRAAVMFNGDICNWDVSKVTNMSYMFCRATVFNKPLIWNTERVITMRAMFLNALSFNQKLDLNVSNVTDMEWMFAGALKFNQSLSWDVARVTKMEGMFATAAAFNGAINAWNISKVRETTGMFYGASSFNQPLHWNVSSVEKMDSMFEKAISFNQDLTTWKAGRVRSATGMFFGANEYNYPVDFLPEIPAFNAFNSNSTFEQEAVKRLMHMTLASGTDGAVNDSSRFGIDRLGYGVYAKALQTVLSNVDTPICVGLYARWGSGKSFMMQLLKYNFDKTVSTHDITSELVQWFDEGWVCAPPVRSHKADAVENAASKKSLGRIGIAKRFCDEFGKLLKGSKVVKSLLPEPLYKDAYSLYVLFELVTPLYEPFWSFIQKGFRLLKLCCKSIVKGELDLSELPTIDSSSTKEVSAKVKEYVFVDFNAWEFSNSDELWAGLIRNIYNKVELRLAMQQHIDKAPLHIRSSRAKVVCEDWKRKWRVQKAVELLLKHYGGKNAIHLRLMVLIIILFGIIVIVILSVLGYINFWTHIMKSVENTLAAIGVGLATLAAAIPSGMFLHKTSDTANTSRGESIFQEANRIQDNIGFLSRVRMELDELFQFIHNFEKSTNIELILTIFVDDLDRCLEGRNVKVLEAIQLLLAIPGAPVMVFMAIDARVVVASIEATINKSLSLEDALISGYEYMDKIVQLPFCIPESPPSKVEALLNSCICRGVSIMNTAQLIQHFHSKLVNYQRDRANSNTEFRAHIPFEQLLVTFTDGTPVLGKQIFEALERERDQTEINYVLTFGRIISSETSDLVALYHKTLRSTYSFAISPNEVLEKLCQAIQQKLEHVALLEQPLSSAVSNPTIETNDSQGTQTTNDATDDIKRIQASETPPNTYLMKTKSDTTTSTMNVFQVEDNTLSEEWTKDINRKMKSLKAEPLLSDAIIKALRHLCKQSESNPRRLKRILNVILVANEVAKCKPEKEENPGIVIASNSEWSSFSAKLAKWIYLCELYPYRMTFLTQMLSDFDQKKSFNAFDDVSKDPIDKQFVYHDPGKFDDLTIGNFYHIHVEKYIYMIESAKKLLRLESDPDLFTVMLFKSFDIGDGKQCIILCKDVLGPLNKETNIRDTNFSLWHYSYTLNPSMMKQIALDLQQLSSELELVKLPEDKSSMKETSTEASPKNVKPQKQRPLLMSGGKIRKKINMIEHDTFGDKFDRTNILLSRYVNRLYPQDMDQDLESQLEDDEASPLIK